MMSFRRRPVFASFFVFTLSVCAGCGDSSTDLASPTDTAGTGGTGDDASTGGAGGAGTGGTSAGGMGGAAGGTGGAAGAAATGGTGGTEGDANVNPDATSCVILGESCDPTNDDCCASLMCDDSLAQPHCVPPQHDSGTSEGGMSEGGTGDSGTCIASSEPCGPGFGVNCCAGLTCKKVTPSDPTPSCLPN